MPSTFQHLRAAHDLSNKDWAHLLGVPEQTIRRWSEAQKVRKGIIDEQPRLDHLVRAWPKCEAFAGLQESLLAFFPRRTAEPVTDAMQASLQVLQFGVDLIIATRYALRPQARPEGAIAVVSQIHHAAAVVEATLVRPIGRRT